MNRLSSAMTCAGLCLLAGMAIAEPTVEFQSEDALFSCDTMSDDGRFVAGGARGLSPWVPNGTYIWDTQTGAITLLNTAGKNAAGISNDGSALVGDTFVEGTPGDPNSIAEEASMWTTSAPFWQSLGYLPDSLQCPSRSNAYDISADGSTVVGLSWDGCDGRGFIWTQADGMLELEPLANGGNRASVVSSDGSVIAGFAQGNFSRTPAVWDAETRQGTLLGPNGADAQGEVLGISNDGSILVGTVYLEAPGLAYSAVKWVNGEVEMIGNGSLLPGWGGHAQDIADDGTVIGYDFLLGNRRPWIQPQGEGPLLELNDWAVAHGAEIPEDWEMIVPKAISDDGTSIIGFGFTPEGIFPFRLVITPGVTPVCDGDANADLAVDLADLNLVLANFGTTNSDGDVNDDGSVDLADLNLVLANFGTACE
ncbi:MAG: hypothetical protein ACF8MJ_05920 [Phycisphaerales bacterium JB050]